MPRVSSNTLVLDYFWRIFITERKLAEFSQENFALAQNLQRSIQVNNYRENKVVKYAIDVFDRYRISWFPFTRKTYHEDH